MTKIDLKKYPNLRLGEKASENNSLFKKLVDMINGHEDDIAEKVEVLSGSGAPAEVLPENVIFQDDDTGDLYMNVDGVNKKYVADNGVKVYRAKIIQAGTDAPVATVLENSLGGNPVWTRRNAGEFTLTLAGAFPADKTFISLNSIYAEATDEANFVDIGYSFSVDTVNLCCSSDGFNTGRDFINTFIEILVYP